MGDHRWNVDAGSRKEKIIMRMLPASPHVPVALPLRRSGPEFSGDVDIAPATSMATELKPAPYGPTQAGSPCSGPPPESAESLAWGSSAAVALPRDLVRPVRRAATSRRTDSR